MFQITYKQIIEGMKRREFLKNKAHTNFRTQDDSVYQPSELAAPTPEYKIMQPDYGCVYLNI